MQISQHGCYDGYAKHCKSSALDLNQHTYVYCSIVHLISRNKEIFNEVQQFMEMHQRHLWCACAVSALVQRLDNWTTTNLKVFRMY